ncbi:MAG: S9 family peptidase [Paraglaciecola sp.]|uniref:S9 family peptidase n=1 Tax=Paraglaciecola sp. TaxID=1920173 RepID=UPI003299B1CC
MNTKMLFTVCFFIMLCACSKQKITETEDTPTKPSISFETYSAHDFFQTTSYGLANANGYAWSHDNKHILIQSDKSGVFNAYTVDENGDQTLLTESDSNAYFVSSFFPDDNRVIVSADQGGNELNHIFVRELDGTLIDVTTGENLKAFFGGWVQNNRAFYVWHNGRNPANFDLYSIDVKSYEASLLFENPGFEPGSISKSGKWLTLDKPRTSADSDIYLVDLLSEEKQPLLITEHQGNIAYSTYDFTPDEKHIVISTNEHGEFNQAWTYNIATKSKAPLIQADWDVSFVFYSPSGRYRIHGINADGLTDITIYDQTTGKELSLNKVPEGELGQIRFSRDESKLAFGLNTDTSPYNLYMSSIGGDSVRLTNALSPIINESNLVTATVERFEASDGTIIPGIMYKPKQASAAQPVPALVFVHGGPGGQSTRGYRALIQHLVNNGYGVYAANNRGSSGYGKTFFHMDDKRHGQEDLRDIVEAGHFLRSLDWVDDQKVGVMGGSYGGYITAAAMTFYPDEFEVGINVFGVTNWLRTLSSIPEWWASFRESLYDEMGDPATDSERHKAISPLFHAEKVTRPMLVVQGANDPRVLQVESDELVQSIRDNGVYVDYVLFPDEGHGFLRKENRIKASEAYINFLDNYLKKP